MVSDGSGGDFQRMTMLLAKRDLKTKYGTFTEHLFDNEAIALTMGDIKADDVLTRIHSSCLSGHAFNSIECQCREEMERAQQMIQDEGLGIIIWLEQEGRGNGHLAVMQSTELKKKGISQTDAYTQLGFKPDARSFEPAAEALHELGVRSVILISGSGKKAEQLREYGVTVKETRSVSGEQ